MIYFSYGSNLNIEQMQHRCYGAEIIGPAALKGYELCFDENGRGRGVANIRPKQGAQVAGAIWRLDARHRASLDAYEGYPHVYTRGPVRVVTKKGSLDAFTYWMKGEPLLTRPSIEYLERIMDGYKAHGLDLNYLKNSIRPFLEGAAI